MIASERRERDVRTTDAPQPSRAAAGLAAPQAPAHARARATVSPADRLQRILADAVTRRADTVAVRSAAPGPSAVLARVRTRRAAAGPSASLGVAPGQGVTKSRRRARAVPTGPRRQSGRARQPAGVDAQVHWKVTFGPATKMRGGSSVQADLGPAAGLVINYGSKPQRNECSAVERLNAVRFKNRKWIKGHLLNDNLGGPGMHFNLTPMTQHANTAFLGFESGVKNALTACYTHAQTDKSIWYGVRVNVAAIGKRFPHERNLLSRFSNRLPPGATALCGSPS